MTNTNNGVFVQVFGKRDKESVYNNIERPSKECIREPDVNTE